MKCHKLCDNFGRTNENFARGFAFAHDTLPVTRADHLGTR